MTTCLARCCAAAGKTRTSSFWTPSSMVNVPGTLISACSAIAPRAGCVAHQCCLCQRHPLTPCHPAPVSAGEMGPFTVNLWFRANASDMDGDIFEYVYSHSKYANRTNFAPVDTFHPNQVRMRLRHGAPTAPLRRPRMASCSAACAPAVPCSQVLPTVLHMQSLQRHMRGAACCSTPELVAWQEAQLCRTADTEATP